MKLIFTFLLFLPVFSIAQPYEKSYTDTALQHQWELADPGLVKMLKSSGEPFLRPVITFGDRNRFNNAMGNSNLEWSFNAKTQQLEIADMEELLVKSYVVKQLDAEILILLIGKQEIVFNRKR